MRYVQPSPGSVLCRPRRPYIGARSQAVSVRPSQYRKRGSPTRRSKLCPLIPVSPPSCRWPSRPTERHYVQTERQYVQSCSHTPSHPQPLIATPVSTGPWGAQRNQRAPDRRRCLKRCQQHLQCVVLLCVQHLQCAVLLCVSVSVYVSLFSLYVSLCVTALYVPLLSPACVSLLSLCVRHCSLSLSRLCATPLTALSRLRASPLSLCVCHCSLCVYTQRAP